MHRDRYIEIQSAGIKLLEEIAAYRKAAGPAKTFAASAEFTEQIIERIKADIEQIQQRRDDEEPFDDPIESVYHNRRLDEMIRQAFAGAPTPADLATRIVWVKALPEDQQRLRGLTWEELTSVEIWQHDLWLHHLDAEYFRYYLPSFLLAAIEIESIDIPEIDNVNLDIGDKIAYELNPSPFGEFSESYRPRLEGLTDAQRAAIRAFLFVSIENSSISEGEKAEELRGMIDEYYG